MADKAKLPFEDSKMAVFLRKQIDALSGMKTQREIAAEIGYDKGNILSMFKRGEAKVPLDRVAAFARALEVSPQFFYRLALEQYGGKEGEALVKELFKNVVSEKEAAVINLIRQKIGGGTVDLTPELVEQHLVSEEELAVVNYLKTVTGSDLTVEKVREFIVKGPAKSAGRGGKIEAVRESA